MLRNIETTYGSVTKFLHWLMAAWIVTAYVVIVWLTWGHTEGLIPGLNYHKVVGFTILLPFIVRIAWRMCNPAPALPGGMPPWQARLSRLSHVCSCWTSRFPPLMPLFASACNAI